MPSAIENIYHSFMTDPNFMVGTPEHEKKEKAWSLAWERHRQTQRNNVALSMAKEEEIAKESVGTMGPDTGASKYPAKIGGPTTIENTKKFGQEKINLHRDPNRTWRTRPETASEMTTEKENLEKISPVAAAKKIFGKPPKTFEEKEVERMRRDFGYTKKGEMPSNKQEQFKAYLKKHLIDTLEEESAEYCSEEDLLNANADSEIMSETAVTIDTIIEALTELRDNISQHELDEMTGQEEDGLELFGSLKKHDRKQPHYHPYAETGPGIDVEAYKKPKSLLPKGQKFLLDPSVKKHYTGPGGKHEHLPWGQVKVPKPKGASWESGKISRDPDTKKPGSWQGYIEKKDFQDLDFKDQDAVIAEREMLARKKPVIKPFIPVGGRKNIISTQKGKPGIFNEQIAASENKSLEKHEDFAMHEYADLSEKKYPFLSHLIPPVKKDTSSVNEITEVQKDRKVGNVFAISTRAAQRLGFSDFSEGSPGKEKRSEIAEALKRKEGIKKEALQKLLFTIKRGKVKSSSVPQHRLLHGRGLDHTHIEGGKYKREKLEKTAKKTLYNVLSNRKYSAPDGTPITTGVTSPQLRVE